MTSQAVVPLAQAVSCEKAFLTEEMRLHAERQMTMGNWKSALGKLVCPN